MKDLEYYMGLPYKIVLYPAREGGYVVELPELPGCLTQAETLEEAYSMAEDAKKAWLLDALEHGDTIPQPEKEPEYSGRILLRTPKSLHRELVQHAKKEGVSLNQYINFQLAKGLRRQS